MEHVEADRIVRFGRRVELDRDGDQAELDRAVSAQQSLLLDEPELAARLGTAARQKADDFSLAKMADAHLTLFQRLCP